jgi:hypothetical protein
MEVETAYFGSDKQGRPVSLDDWHSFLANEVTPAFPDGLTWWVARGQWRSGTTIVPETSYVLSILHEPSEQRRLSFAKLADRYKEIHQQESVLITRTVSCARF